MATIAFDVDGVLAAFNLAYANLFIHLQGKDPFPKGWRNNPEWPPEWFWNRAYGCGGDCEKKAWDDHILKNGWFWERLDPLPDTEEVFKQINALSRQNHAVYFLTDRAGLNAKRQTEKWLYAQGIDYPTAILTRTKIPVLKALNADFFIDDKLDTLNQLMQAVDDEKWRMDGKYFCLLDRPYNRVGRRNDVNVVTSVEIGMRNAGLWT